MQTVFKVHQLTMGSTGGIIALGLTARNMTVDQCAHSFDSLCRQAFTARKGINVPGISKLVEHYNQSKYETHPFEAALKTAFNDKQYLFGGQREDNDRLDINVAVTTTSAAGSSVVLSNYNRLCLEKRKSHNSSTKLALIFRSAIPISAPGEALGGAQDMGSVRISIDDVP